jgi:hypothetical protein
MLFLVAVAFWHPVFQENQIYSFQKIKQIFSKTEMPECHCQDATDVTIILKINKKIVIRKKEL